MRTSSEWRAKEMVVRPSRNFDCSQGTFTPMRMMFLREGKEPSKTTTGGGPMAVKSLSEVSQFSMCQR